VRSGVGVCDVSTLGKIDIQGRMPLASSIACTSTCSRRCPSRQGALRTHAARGRLGLDDGTTARLAPEHYLMSTTTANAAKVMQHLEHARQVLWPELDVQMVSVTEQWAQYAIAGPNARLIYSSDCSAMLLTSRTPHFPIWPALEFSWRGIPARLFRISFSGELAYELAVPARYGDADYSRHQWPPGADPRCDVPTASKPSASCASKRDTCDRQ
jgi:glycine cleavage system aminomethyltransferase T